MLRFLRAGRTQKDSATQMNTIKSTLISILKPFLKKAGWKLQPINTISRPTMTGGLQWLHDHNFHVKTVLDVGASDGRWAKQCMTFFPEADYVLFEPQPIHKDALDLFQKSCKQKVTVVKRAVGAEEGETLFDASDPFGGALAETSTDKTITATLTTVDDAVAGLQAESPFLLKLDTHGFEKSILKGAEDTLEKAEVLIIEAYNYKISNEAWLFWELCAFLSQKGFSPVDLVDVMHRDRDNSLWQMDLFFIKSTWDGFKKSSYY